MSSKTYGELFISFFLSLFCCDCNAPATDSNERNSFQRFNAKIVIVHCITSDWIKLLYITCVSVWLCTMESIENVIFIWIQKHFLKKKSEKKTW